ncbi:LacI family DNA-binding transcriptional regulator [Actinopolymorpha sp. NPDC004070]|uniref:LacI family DNA-binding transcriptional regulator n=1 Tax=Actinopolymorpha sp. NPDC004070 TaxID=3154548 RepID=UPI0033A5E821
MGARRRSTLREVAARAGVSIGTASGVFTSNAAVSEQARKAVLAAAEEIGYQPRRRPAESLAAGVSAFGLLARGEHYVGPANPFYGPVLYGAQSAIAALGVSLVMETLHDGDRDSRALPLVLRRRQAQGLLLAGYHEQRYVERLLETGTPCVLIDHLVEDLPVDCVRADDHRGGYLATTHLLDLGHRNPPPAIITGPSTAYSITARLAGYHQALAEYGVPADPAYVRGGRLSAESGREEMAALLDLPVPPTSVFCGNDNTALGAIDLLRERGIAVPTDVSVIGYDDIAMAAHSVPGLTTIAVDKELLGMQAVWNLTERLRFPHMGWRETRVGVHLVVRGSTAPRNPPAPPYEPVTATTGTTGTTATTSTTSITQG